MNCTFLSMVVAVAFAWAGAACGAAEEVGPTDDVLKVGSAAVDITPSGGQVLDPPCAKTIVCSGRITFPVSGESTFQAEADGVKQLAPQASGGAAPMAREDRSRIYRPGRTNCVDAAEGPVRLGPGPHLFIDDYLVERSENVARKVTKPDRDRRIPNPIVTAKEDRCFQPFFTVSRRPEDGRWRIWYGAWRDDKRQDRSHLAYMESEDGIGWSRPARICETPELQFGSDVLDRGPEWADPASRYVYGYWLGGGLRILVSADGLRWQPLVEVRLPLLAWSDRS